DQGVELARDPGDQGGGGGDVLVDVLEGDVDRLLADEGLAAGEHLEQHHAQGVEVAALVGVAAGDDLGADVRDRAQQGRARRGVRRADRAGQTEIGDLHHV